VLVEKHNKNETGEEHIPSAERECKGDEAEPTSYSTSSDADPLSSPNLPRSLWLVWNTLYRTKNEYRYHQRSSKNVFSVQEQSTTSGKKRSRAQNTEGLSTPCREIFRAALLRENVTQKRSMPDRQPGHPRLLEHLC